MKYVLSTIAGVESIAKKEIQKQGGKIEETTDRLITFSGGVELIPRINLWSRVGNKMYLLLAEEDNVLDFDQMFDIIGNISWKKYFKKDFPIIIKSSSIRSDLYSARTIQSLGKKAIVNSLVGEGGIVNEDDNLEKLEVLILIIDNKLRVLLNTSGDALHMRGYRTKSGDAPIKESLAAALVLLSGWRFRDPFYDVFCGSGTIAIEALMIAKNIAPGLKRSFAFERLGLVSSEVIENEKLLAQKKQYNGDYTIKASDIDDSMIDIAQENALRAGLAGEINFELKDFKTYFSKDLKGCLVSNPPYGDRLKDEDLVGIYNNIDKLLRVNENLNGGVISSFMDFDNIISNRKMYKKRKLYNGGEKCYFWKKVN